MKTYKKLATLAPIAVLSTSILFSPAMTFAAEKTTSIPMKSAALQTSNVTATNAFSVEQFKKDVQKAIANKLHQANPAIQIDESSIQFSSDDWSYSFVNSGNINIDAKVDKYKDAGSIELLQYKNETPVNQTQKMNGNSVTHTESSTYSNTEGVTIGIGTETKLSVSVPFVAEGGETIKTTTDFNYSHSSSSTTTDTRTETFPEQSVVCVPNATTVYTGIVRTAEFSGSYTGAANAVGSIGDITAKDINGNQISNVSINVNGNILNIFDANSLPSYVEVQNGQRVINNMSATFKGIAGHQQIVQAKTYPLGSTQAAKTVEMSLKDFQNPQIRNAKLAEIQK